MGPFPKPTVSILIQATRRWLREERTRAGEMCTSAADPQSTLFPSFLQPPKTLMFQNLLQKLPNSYLAAHAGVHMHHQSVSRRNCLGAIAKSGCGELCRLLLLGFALLSTHENLGKLPEKDSFDLTLSLWNGWKSNNVIAGMPTSVPGSANWCRSPGCRWAMTGSFPLPVRVCWSCKHSQPYMGTSHQCSWQWTSHHFCNCYWIGGFFLLPCNLKILFQSSQSFTLKVCFQSGDLEKGWGIKTLQPSTAAQQPSKVTSKGSPRASDLPCPFIIF